MYAGDLHVRIVGRSAGYRLNRQLTAGMDYDPQTEQDGEAGTVVMEWWYHMEMTVMM
jgi:hypothetical protein